MSDTGIILTNTATAYVLDVLHHLRQSDSCFIESKVKTESDGETHTSRDSWLALNKDSSLDALHNATLNGNSLKQPKSYQTIDSYKLFKLFDELQYNQGFKIQRHFRDAYNFAALCSDVDRLEDQRLSAGQFPELYHLATSNAGLHSRSSITGLVYTTFNKNTWQPFPVIFSAGRTQHERNYFTTGIDIFIRNGAFKGLQNLSMTRGYIRSYAYSTAYIATVRKTFRYSHMLAGYYDYALIKETISDEARRTDMSNLLAILHVRTERRYGSYEYGSDTISIGYHSIGGEQCLVVELERYVVLRADSGRERLSLVRIPYVTPNTDMLIGSFMEGVSQVDVKFINMASLLLC